MSLYIKPDTMTDRQLWAAGALAERFYKAGTLETISPARDQDAENFLAQNGFQPVEIAPLVDHMNACSDMVKAMDAGQKQNMVSVLEDSIRAQRHKTPAPL